MKISVVTVCFNAAGTIEDTLRSVAEQNYPNVEHLVIDGGSTDATRDIVRRFSRSVSKFHSGSDQGIYDAMNIGLGMATGDFVMFLNADDRYANPGSISAMANGLRCSGAQTAYADISYVAADDPSRRLRRWRSGEYRRGAFAAGWAPPHPAFVASRSVLRNLGGFDLRYRLAADFDLMMRALDGASHSTTYVERELVLMKIGGATNATFGNVVRQNLEILDSIRRAGHRYAAPRLVTRKILVRFRQKFEAWTDPRRDTSP
jgi:glycosyltransferase involved in cell wall biosynthesis